MNPAKENKTSDGIEVLKLEYQILKLKLQSLQLIAKENWITKTKENLYRELLSLITDTKINLKLRP